MKLTYLVAILLASVLFCALTAMAHDDPWFSKQQINPKALERFGPQHAKSCCGAGDVVDTKFKVDRKGDDAWYYLKLGQWKRIPNDIIHWGEHAPSKQATLFVNTYSGLEVCFFPPEGGI